MNDLDSFATEVPNEEAVLGLIGGMIDGVISGFEYKGLSVHNMNGSIAVAPEGPPQKRVGGMMLLKGATVPGVKKWLDRKAEIYGDA